MDATGKGVGDARRSALGFSSEASRESTELIRKALIRMRSAGEISPRITYVRAAATAGRSPPPTICKHCAAESAR